MARARERQAEKNAAIRMQAEGKRVWMAEQRERADNSEAMRQAQFEAGSQDSESLEPPDNPPQSTVYSPDLLFRGGGLGTRTRLHAFLLAPRCQVRSEAAGTRRGGAAAVARTRAREGTPPPTTWISMLFAQILGQTRMITSAPAALPPLCRAKWQHPLRLFVLTFCTNRAKQPACVLGGPTRPRRPFAPPGCWGLPGGDTPRSSSLCAVVALLNTRGPTFPRCSRALSASRSAS